jgi:multiple sugar transport system substrate-binding protein
VLCSQLKKVQAASLLSLPALISTAKSDAFLGLDSPPANREAFITEGENSKPGRTGFFPEWNELDGTIISPAMQRIWSGEATPDEVLPGLCEQVDAFLQENGFPK